MKIATAFVELRADTSKFKQDMNGAKDQARGAASGIASAFGAAAFGFGIKRSIDAASDLNETVSKTKVIFGATTATVIKASEQAAKSMGMSKRAYLDAAAGLKGLLDNMGLAADESTKWAMDLTGLGSDLASFFNTDPADAIYAISAALRGESEPIRRYNVQLSDMALKQKAVTLGLYDGKGALDANQRAQAALAVIMDQTTAAQGDFARTADGVANSQRSLKAQSEDTAATMGQNLLPAYQGILGVASTLVGVFAVLPQYVQVSVVALLGLALLSGPISTSVKAVQGLTVAMRNMGSTAKGAAAAAGILATAVIALDVVNRLTEDADQATDAMNAFLVSTADASFADPTAAGITDLVNGFRTLARETGEAQGVVSQTWDVLKAGFEDGSVEANLWADTYEETFRKLQEVDPNKAFDVAMALQQIADAAANGSTGAQEMLDELMITPEMIDKWATSAENAAAAQETLTGGASDAAEQVQAQADAANRGKAANDSLKKSLDPVWDAFDAAAQAAEDLQAAMDEIFGPTRDMDQAAEDLAASVDDLAASFKDNGATLDVSTEKGRANRKAVRDQADSILALTTAMVTNGASTRDAAKYANALTEQMRDQLVALGLTREEADAYIATLGLTPENIETSVKLANAETSKAKLQEMIDQLGELDEGSAVEIQALIDEGKYAEAERRLKKIAEARGVKLNVSLSGGGQVSISGVTGGQMYRVVASADGNVFDRPTVSLFGEAGREAILPLERPSALRDILSDSRVAGPVAAAMPSLVGGGGVHVENLVVGSRQDADAMGQALGRLAWRIAT